jgi:hypothetical protein
MNNEQIARDVMGWEKCHDGRWTFWTDDLPEGVSGASLNVTALPPFTTDIAAAWLVVERMRELGWSLDLHGSSDTGWTAWLKGDGFKVFACADTAPEAICAAALKAMEVSNG